MNIHDLEKVTKLAKELNQLRTSEKRLRYYREAEIPELYLRIPASGFGPEDTIPLCTMTRHAAREYVRERIKTVESRLEKLGVTNTLPINGHY